MTKNRTTKKDTVPPQFLGVLRDALEIGATAFRLEPNPPHIMAVFSTGSQAAEIDFERWAGQEMIDYLRGQITDRKTKSGIFVLGDEGKQYRWRVTVDHVRSPKRVEVMWASPEDFGRPTSRSTGPPLAASVRSSRENLEAGFAAGAPSPAAVGELSGCADASGRRCAPVG